MDFLKNNTIKIFIVIVAVLTVAIIGISLLSKLGGNGAADENALISAAKRYYNSKTDLLPKGNYETATVTVNSLINAGYLKQAKDENGNVKTCFSYVTVVKSGEEYIYIPYVKCNDENDTKLLSNIITTNVGTNNDGVYKINDEYIYKGENPNNYVKFSEELWRVVKMNKDGIIKIIYSDSDYDSDDWDDRYNIQENENTGINDYKVSRISTYLKDYIKDNEIYTNDDRAKITFSDLCIGKRKLDDATTNGTTECASKMEKQMVGLLQANEYLNASNDPNCSPTSQKACQNYNFLAQRSYWTITGVEENTKDVYKVYPEVGLKAQEAENGENILPVLFLKSDTAISGGTGTAVDPYVIR